MAEPKQRKFPAEHYSRDECLALLAAAGDSWIGRRNQVLISVLWRSGLRLAEALALEPKDADFFGSTLRVLHGKGDKARTVGMDGQGSSLVRLWLDERGEGLETAPLVCTRAGGTLKQSYVRALLPRLAEKAGVRKRVHAHGFRHTFAVELLREGVPVAHIQQLL